jgi:hypothetical protein
VTKNGLANLTKEKLGIEKNIRHILRKKKARSCHLLLITAEDPSQCTYLRNLKIKTLHPISLDLD